MNYLLIGAWVLWAYWGIKEALTSYRIYTTNNDFHFIYRGQRLVRNLLGRTILLGFFILTIILIAWTFDPATASQQAPDHTRFGRP